MKRRAKFLAIMLLLWSGTRLLAQNEGQIYRTMNGQLTITGSVGDSVLMMRSNDLVISLDYESAELVIRLNKETLGREGETESANSLSNTSSEVLFKGKLGIDYVITQKHPPLDFEVEGYLFNGNEKSFVTGNGHLEHIHANEYACILNLDFFISPDLLSIDWPGEEKVKVQIIQTVLKRRDE